MNIMIKALIREYHIYLTGHIQMLLSFIVMSYVILLFVNYEQLTMFNVLMIKKMT